MEKFLRLKDVAEMTGIPLWTLRRWLRMGKGPAYRKSPVSNVYLFRLSDVKRWADDLDGTAHMKEAS